MKHPEYTLRVRTEERSHSGSTILQHGAHPALQLPLLVEHGRSMTGFISALKGEHSTKEVSNSNIGEQKMTCLLLTFTSGEFWRILVHKSPLRRIRDKQEVTDLIKMPCCWPFVAPCSKSAGSDSQSHSFSH